MTLKDPEGSTVTIKEAQQIVGELTALVESFRREAISTPTTRRQVRHGVSRAVIWMSPSRHWQSCSETVKALHGSERRPESEPTGLFYAPGRS
jgi:hypothetical protein